MGGIYLVYLFKAVTHLLFSMITNALFVKAYEHQCPNLAEAQLSFNVTTF